MTVRSYHQLDYFQGLVEEADSGLPRVDDTPVYVLSAGAVAAQHRCPIADLPSHPVFARHRASKTFVAPAPTFASAITSVGAPAADTTAAAGSHVCFPLVRGERLAEYTPRGRPVRTVAALLLDAWCAR